MTVYRAPQGRHDSQVSLATLSPPSQPTPAVRLWRRIRWWVPGVIVVLLLGATSFLLTLSELQERGEAEDQLVTDSLWVRQSLQFQLERESEALDLIGDDYAQGSLSREALEARLRVFLRRGRESLGVALVGPNLPAAVNLSPEASPAGPDPVGSIPAAAMEAAIDRKSVV